MSEWFKTVDVGRERGTGLFFRFGATFRDILGKWAKGRCYLLRERFR